MNFKESINAFREQSSQWEKELGLFDLSLDMVKLEEILNYNQNRLYDMSPEDAAVASVMISQLCVEIQYHENRCKSFIKWRDQIIAYLNNEDKQKINQMVDIANQKICRLAFMTKRLDNFSQSLYWLQKAKENK